MDRWLAKVVDLLEAPDPVARVAAARVLGALKPQVAGVVEALGRALGSEDRRVQAAALEAIESIGIPDVKAHLVPLLDDPADLGQGAQEAAGRLGPAALKPLKRAFAEVGEVGRRRILDLAIHLRGADGMDIVVRALEKGLCEPVRQAGRSLAEELAGAKTRERTTLARRIDRFLTSPDGQRDPESAATAIELLGAILGPEAHARLLAYAAPGHHPALRRRSLDALARVAAESDIPEQDLTALLGYLAEPDYTNVVAPVMEVLEHARLSPAHTRKLLDCLRSEDPALRRFAVTALGQVDTPQAASALLQVLAGDNPDLRKRAALALANQTAAIPLVATALAGADDSQTAWILARILHPHSERLRPEQLTALARAAALWLEPGDPRAEAVISLLGGDRLRHLAEEGVKRVKKMKRERNAGEIVNLLRPLVREGGELGPMVRYELALAEVVRGKKDVLREARLAHPGLKGLEGLVQDVEFGLLGRLKRDKHYLTPNEYYLIGCHFSERSFGDRIFGGELLRWMVKTFPEDNCAEAAANKLLMEGFPPPPRRKPPPRKAVAPKKAPPKKTVAKKTTPAKKKAPAKKKPVVKKKAPAPKKAPAKKKPVAKTKAAKRPRR